MMGNGWLILGDGWRVMQYDDVLWLTNDGLGWFMTADG